MSEKEIINKLQSLKNIKADNAWKQGNRSILISQIYGTSKSEAELEFNWLAAFGHELSASLMGKVSRSIATVILSLIFIGSAGTASFIAARETKPGDSLYMAKIMGEKAQLVFTFDDNAKAKLGLQFASNRAEELSKVLAEKGGDGDRAQTAENLVNNFKKEISEVKSRIVKISPEAANLARRAAGKDSQSDRAKTGASETAEDNNHFFQADLGKDKNGIDLSEPVTGSQKDEVTPASTTGQEIEKIAASTTPQLADPKVLVEQAQELLNQGDYGGIINKLEEADKAISQVKIDESHEVTSTANATTTDSNQETESGTSTDK